MAAKNAGAAGRVERPVIHSTSETQLSKLVQGQLDSISAMNGWLERRSAAGPHYTEIASVVKEHIVHQKTRLFDAQKTLAWRDFERPGWGPVTCTRSSDDDLIFSVNGSALGEPLEVEVASSAEAASFQRFVNSLSEMSEMLATGEARIKRLASIISESMELRSQLSVPHQEVAQDHIRSLRQYNDIKDIAQQLIGLIAENKGVSIGSLYQHGQYGVTPDD